MKYYSVVITGENGKTVRVIEKAGGIDAIIAIAKNAAEKMGPGYSVLSITQK